METVTTGELRSWIDERREFILLDVLGSDEFAELRLPGAHNACVFQTTFLDQVECDKDAVIVTYGSSANSRDAADAQARLLAAGYRNVRRYEGGRAAWVAAGHPVEGTARTWEPRPSLPLPDGRFEVATAESVIEWTGRNIGNRHYGTLRLRDGSIAIRDGALAAGSFTIDMGSIEVGDLEGDMAAALVRHLRHDDFFAVDRFPTGRVAVDAAVPLRGALPGAANHEVEASVTLRDKTASVRFMAAVWPKADRIALHANFDIDRTRWGINYGSAKLYERLGMHLVEDPITLQIQVLCG